MQIPSRQRIRQLLAGAMLVVALGLLALILRGKPTSSPPLSPDAAPAGADMALKRFEFSEMQGARLAWRLVADKAVYEKDGGTAQLQVVSIIIHDEHGGTMTITAPRGTFQEKRQLVTLLDDVHGVSSKGMIMSGDVVYYNAKAGLVSSDRPVKVVDGRLTLTGTGMTMTVKDSRVRFTGPVTSVIEGNHGKKR